MGELALGTFVNAAEVVLFTSTYRIVVLVGSVLSGFVRDLVVQLARQPVSGYSVVFVIEALMLLGSLFILRRLDVGAFRKSAGELDVVERIALANEA